MKLNQRHNFKRKFHLNFLKMIEMATKNQEERINDADTYICESCGACYASYHGWSRHVRNHHEGPRNVKCETCGKTYISLDGLKDHIARVHEGGWKEYICDTCAAS